MAFVNLSLLAGAVFVAIPVILHLLMRQRPKQVVFPALRFIHQRRLANQRQLHLRHWLLLALRCAAVGVLVLALARPTVASGAFASWLVAGVMGLMAVFTGVLAVAAHTRGVSRIISRGLGAIAAALLVGMLITSGRALAGRSPIVGDQEAPVAAAIVIDTSPRMQYRHKNKTRLEAAQDTAKWLLRQLPAESELAVFDSKSGSGAFAVDRMAAEKIIDRLQAAGTPRPLVEVLQAATQLVKQKTERRKELYVFTDLTAAAWKDPGQGALKKLLAEQADTLLYLVDVGVENPRNFALGELTLSGEVLPAGSELTIQSQISASGIGGQRTIELWVEQIDPTLPIIRDGQSVLPKAFLRDSRSVELTPGARQQVEFRLTGSLADARERSTESTVGLQPGTHHGWVRIVGQDGLAIDDIRYFAVEVQAAWPVLLAAPTNTSARFLAEALAPQVLRESNRASFRCDVIEQSELAGKDLSDYRAVALLDPASLPAEVWKKLAAYCENGGGLAIFLGHNAQPAAFQDAAAVRVLGGKLTLQSRSAGDVFLSPHSYDHAILAGLRAYSTSVPWDRFPIYYHWNLDQLGDDARAVINYSDGKPAVVENRLGEGRVLTMTTPITDPPRPEGRQAWNELLTGEDAWPGFALVYEMMQYAVKSGQMKLNLLAGETAILPNDPAQYPERYQLFTPLEQPQDVLARDGRVTIRFTDQPGAYRLRGQKDGPLVRGFAVNLAGDTSDLTRAPREQLDETLGLGRYKITRGQEAINRAVGQDRIGSEFYPVLMTLVALVLGLEHVLANRFYTKVSE